MTIAIGDVIRVVWEWDMPLGTIAQMVQHWQGISGTTSTEAQLGLALQAHLNVAWDEIDDEVADVVTPATQELLRWDFVNNRWDGVHSQNLVGPAGIAVSEMLPHGAAGLVKMFTVAARRQGRKYVPGLSENSQADGTIDGAATSALGLFGIALDDDVISGGLTLESGTFNTEPTSPVFETFSATSHTAQGEAVVAYQRRRRPGTGI